MIYPTTLPCPSLPATQSGASPFLRTDFEFAIRQRGLPFSGYTLEAVFLCNSDAQMAEFRRFFYTDLIDGTKRFDADWIIEGSTALKQFRFSAPYKTTPLGSGSYSVKASFDMLTPIKDI